MLLYNFTVQLLLYNFYFTILTVQLLVYNFYCTIVTAQLLL